MEKDMELMYIAANSSIDYIHTIFHDRLSVISEPVIIESFALRCKPFMAVFHDVLCPTNMVALELLRLCLLDGTAYGLYKQYPRTFAVFVNQVLHDATVDDICSVNFPLWRLFTHDDTDLDSILRQIIKNSTLQSLHINSSIIENIVYSPAYKTSLAEYVSGTR